MVNNNMVSYDKCADIMNAVLQDHTHQFEGLKNIFSALSGDDEPGEVNGDYEQVPYTTLKKFDVSFLDVFRDKITA